MNPTLVVRRLVIGAVLLAALVSRAATPVESRITAVTVYADRAIVTRNASVDIASPGPLEILFNQLPATLVPASLQVAGRGTAQVTILDVSARNTYLDHTPDQKVKAIEDELRSLERQKSANQDNDRLLMEQGQTLIRMEGALTTPPTKDMARPSIEELTKLMNFLTEQRTQIVTAKAALAIQLEQLTAKIEALEQQIRDLQRDQSRSVKAVVVRLAAATAGKLELTLSYSLPGASWAPAYDARLRTEERTVELSYFGQVRNGTGEAWQDVALTLSTARPSLGGGAPDLASWVVDVQPPPGIFVGTRQKRSAGAVSSEELLQYTSSTEVGGLAGNRAAIAMAPEAPIEHDATSLTAAVDAKGTSATFRIPVPVTLPSDNTFQKIGITSFKLTANLQFESTPKASETVFLHAYTTNTSEYPLLAGSMNTFLDGTFVATSRLNTVMTGEKFMLALGADEGIALKRKLVNRFSEDTGLTSRTKRVTYDYLYTVTNNKKTAERVVFKDAVPVSRNEKITVKVVTPPERDTGTLAAPKEVTNETDGRYVWRFDLKPGEKREFSFKFYVEHPADVAVIGVE